jgi:hypothetical protein
MRFVRERYLTLDRRVLGVFRILFGLLMLVDLLRRLQHSTFFYSNDGAFSNHHALFAPILRPFLSVYVMFSTPGEVRFAFVATALVFVAYALGYRTRLAQALSFVLFTSLNTRNFLIHNRGTDLVGILALWTLFLPLGDRFSIDAVLGGWRARRESTADMLNERARWAAPPAEHVSLVALAIALQIAIIYTFSAVAKTGSTWSRGEAIHLVLWQNRVATSFAAWLRLHEPLWLSPAMTTATLIVEGLAPVLVLSPVAQRFTRTANLALTTALHGGIALLISVGPFSYVMFTLNLLLLPRQVADCASRALGRGAHARTVVFAERHERSHAAARALSALDSFERITFEAQGATGAAADAPPGAAFASLDPETGKWQGGWEGIVLAASALPVGGALSALLRVAGSGGRGARWLAGGRDRSPEGQFPSPPTAPRFRLWARESAVLALMLLSGIDASNFGAIPASLRIHESEDLVALVHYTGLNQKWGMFAPDAPRTDGTLVVDALTVDGRHIDPFTGKPPDLDAPFHGPWYPGSLYCDYFSRMSGANEHQAELKRYLTRWQQVEHRPASDRLVSFTVYWVYNDAPVEGTTRPRNVGRKVLFELSPEPTQPDHAAPPDPAGRP